MKHFEQHNGKPLSIASDSVASFEPYNGGTLIFMKGGDQAPSYRVKQDYGAVKDALEQDDFNRSMGRC